MSAIFFESWLLPGFALLGLAVLSGCRALTRRRALHQAELQLRRFMQNSPEALMILDVSAGRFSMLNERTVELFGRPMEQLLEMGVADVSPPVQPGGQDSQTAAAARIQEALDGGMPVFPWVHRNALGEDVPCEVRLVHIPHERKVLVRGSVVDVSDRLRADEELRRSEQRYRAVVDAQQELVSRWLPDGTFTFANAAFCRFLGRAAGDLLGTSLFEDLSPADRARVEQNLRRMTPDEPLIVSEVEMPNGDGELRWVEWSDKGIFDGQGKLVEIQSVGRDITIRRTAQRDLEYARSLLTAAMDASPAGIIIADAPDGTIRLANRAVMNILGADADNIQDVVERVRVQGYYDPDGRRFEPENLPMRRALTQGLTTHPTEMRMLGADGQERWIANSGAPIRNASGEIIAGIAVATDITDIKRTQLAIRGVVASVSAVTGKEFCQVLVLDLSKVLGVEMGLIVRRIDGQDRNQILALAVDGEITRLHPEYDSHGSPSGEVMRRGRCLAWDNVQQHFPEDENLAAYGMNGYIGVPLLARDARTLGMLAVMSRGPLEAVSFKTEILELFAVRAAAELERERTALALIESEARFRTAFEEAPIGTVILDRDGHLRRANKSFCRILGRSSEELASLRLQEVVHAEAAACCVEPYLGAAAPAGKAGEGRMLRADQSEVWVNYSAQTMLDPAGETRHLVMIEDTTARKRAERDLRTIRELQTIITEASASFVGVAGTEVDAQIRSALARVGEFLDVDRIFLFWVEGKTANVTHYWQREGIQAPVTKVSLTTQIPVIARTLIKGQVFSFEDIDELVDELPRERELFVHQGTRSFLVVPVKAAGSLVGACAVATSRQKRAWPPDLVQWMRVFGDLLAAATARKRSEERQEVSRRQLRALTHELSRAEDEERRRCAIYLHDQIGQALALLRMKLAELDRESPAEALRPSITKLTELVDDAIDDAQTLTFDLSPPLLHELGLAAAIEWLGEKFCRENGLEFDLEVVDDSHEKGAAGETASILFRAVRELLMNVVKHAAATRVRIRVEYGAAGTNIDVHDDGVGFDTSTLTANRGMHRFGLFSIRERLDFIGGSFEISSESGHGTRATLFAPADSAAEFRKGDRE